MVHGFTYFRPGELTLLLEANPNSYEFRLSQDYQPLGSDYLAQLSGQLGRIEVQLHRNMVEGEAGRWTLHPMRRMRRRYDADTGGMIKTQRVRALQTVHLDSWRPDLQRSDDVDALTRSIEQVRRASESINQQIEDAGGRISLEDYELVGASPNWIGVAFQYGFESGSPAGQPQKPARPDRPVRFHPQRVQTLVDQLRQRFPGHGTQETPVKVAIFDTWPMDDPGDPLARIRACRDRLRQRGIASLRLDHAADGGIVRADRIYDYVSRWNFAGGPVFRLGCDGRLEDAYRLSDHGLFIADLINDIAPGAEISVYRVLTDWGGTHMDMLEAAVEDAIVTAGDAPLLLNFSMGLGPELALSQTVLNETQRVLLDAQFWAGEVVAQARSVASRRSDLELQNLRAAKLLSELNNDFARDFAAINDSLNMDGMDNVLAVAAAGNDSCRPGRLFGPRLPAAIEGVVGVSATRRDGSFSHFSNANDIFGPNDGTYAFGGEAEGSRTADGLIGLYVSDELPPGVSGGNTHGRALWAGTSFATPIVTAVAARLWAESPPGTTADEIREAIVAGPIDLMQE